MVKNVTAAPSKSSPDKYYALTKVFELRKVIQIVILSLHRSVHSYANEAVKKKEITTMLPYLRQCSLSHSAQLLRRES